MPYVETFDRNQMMLATWDTMVDDNSIARIIDAFVNSLDLSKYGVKEAAKEGRPLYNPKGLLKLYIYGHRNQMRSSRQLAKSCHLNIEVKWLVGGVEPDFRTISDFRKDNIDVMKKVFHEFNNRLKKAVEIGEYSIDGSKFAACNSKNNNFTKTKLDDRITWLGEHIEEYLRILDQNDAEEEAVEEGGDKKELTKEFIEAKLKEAEERLELYKSYQKIMEETGASQMSLTDADSRLMKNKNGFGMSYNPQTAVDTKSHLIMDYNMTNQVTDHGQIYPTLEQVKEEKPDGIIDAIADKGYIKTEDMEKCLENGIKPHVITEDGQDGYEVKFDYEPSDETDPSSTHPEELSKCLHAGVIPDAYNDILSNVEIKTVRKRVYDEPAEQTGDKPVYGTMDELTERAMQGYFVREPEANIVICPAGNILHQKCVKKNGCIRYANKQACRKCPNRNICYKGVNTHKEIDFTKDCLEKPCKDWIKAKEAEEDAKAKAEPETDNVTGKNRDAENESAGSNNGEAKSYENKVESPMEKNQSEEKKPKRKYHYEEETKVSFTLTPDRLKTANRMCTSEHPFGTIKRTMDSGYFLLKGMKKVDGEFALFCLGYNLQRAYNMLGFEKLMELMRAA